MNAAAYDSAKTHIKIGIGALDGRIDGSERCGAGKARSKNAGRDLVRRCRNVAAYEKRQSGRKGHSSMRNQMPKTQRRVARARWRTVGRNRRCYRNKCSSRTKKRHSWGDPWCDAVIVQRTKNANPEGNVLGIKNSTERGRTCIKLFFSVRKRQIRYEVGTRIWYSRRKNGRRLRELVRRKHGAKNCGARTELLQ